MKLRILLLLAVSQVASSEEEHYVTRFEDGVSFFEVVYTEKISSPSAVMCANSCLQRTCTHIQFEKGKFN